MIKGKHVNRHQHLIATKSPIVLPDIIEARNIHDWILELGMYSNGMNGPIPISYQEIQAWATLTGTQLMPCEVLILRNLSMEFCSQYSKSDIKCPPPYKPKGGEDKVAMGAQFLAVLDSINNIEKEALK